MKNTFTTLISQNIRNTIIFLILIIISTNANSTGIDTTNKALQFDGLNDYVEITNSDFDLDSAMTVMALIKWDTNPQNGNAWANIFSVNAHNKGNLGIFWLQHNFDNSKFEFALSTTQGRSIIQSQTTPVQGEWYCIAATYDKSHMRLYINGVEEAHLSKTGSIASHHSTYKATIGQWAYQGDNYRRIKGTIDNVSVWNKALSAEEISEAMCNMCSFNLDGVVAMWKMNEVLGTTVNDITSDHNGVNHGTADIVQSTVLPCNSLPIELVSFDAQMQANAIHLSWITASEINNDYFTIEKSFDANSFEILAYVAGAGNSNIVLNYEYFDHNIDKKTVYYRLKQTDFDGKFEYSDVIAVDYTNPLNANIYPTVLRSGQAITVSAQTEVQVKVYDITGNLVIDNANSLQIPTQGLTQGLYIVTIESVYEAKSFKITIM